MPEGDARSLEHDDLVLTDRDLFSLYLQYPDMLPPDQQPHDEAYAEPPLTAFTSSPESSPQSRQIYSSPSPHPTRYDTPASSPFGPADIVPFPALTIAANEQDVDDLTARFDLTLKSYDLAQETAEFLAEAKSAIVVMGSILFSSTGEVCNSLDNIWRVESTASWLSLSLNHACRAIEKEIHAAESIVQLAPFTVRPAPQDLWTNYKQMAELIIQRTTIPSAQELDLFTQLSCIYDACVYHQLLSISHTHTSSDRETLLTKLDSLYNAVMTLCARQKQWISAMKRIGDHFTRPTMRRILQSPDVMKNILELEGQIEAVDKSIAEMESATEKLMTAVNAENRTRHQQLSQHEGLALHQVGASAS